MSKEAMKLALEAADELEWMLKSGYEQGREGPPRVHRLIGKIKALAEQPAQQQEPVAIKWTLDGDKTCVYDNWLGETPFGRILITWKGWKKYHDACVDEFPGDFSAYGSPDEVKAMCEAEFAKRSGYTSPPAQRTWEEWFKWWRTSKVADSTEAEIDFADFMLIVRAVEAAHGIKEQS